MKIIRHELRPPNDHTQGKICRICGERFPHRTAAVMVVMENSILDVEISEATANVIDFYRHSLTETEVVPCQPPRRPINSVVIHRVGVYIESGHGKSRDPQECVICGIVCSLVPPHHPPGDVYQVQGASTTFFTGKDSDFTPTSSDLEAAMYCQAPRTPRGDDQGPRWRG